MMYLARLIHREHPMIWMLERKAMARDLGAYSTTQENGMADLNAVG